MWKVERPLNIPSHMDFIISKFKSVEQRKMKCGRQKEKERLSIVGRTLYFRFPISEVGKAEVWNADWRKIGSVQKNPFLS